MSDQNNSDGSFLFKVLATILAISGAFISTLAGSRLMDGVNTLRYAQSQNAWLGEELAKAIISDAGMQFGAGIALFAFGAFLWSR